MTDNINWSASLGRWMGIPVRVHLLLLLFIALVFGIQSQYSSEKVLLTALATSICLIGCILLHELAHVFALTNLGGLVNNIVLTPWGGNSDFSLPEDTRARAIVQLAGPIFSGCLFVLGSVLIFQSDHSSPLRDLVNPFAPIPFYPEHREVSFLKIATWINFQLMVVNLIPCFPFDGGDLIRTLVNRISSQASLMRRESTILVIGQATGLTLIGCGWFLKGEDICRMPVWLLCVMGGLTLIFAARYSYYRQLALADEEWDDSEEMDYDSIYGDSSFFDFSTEDDSSYSQWLLEKQEDRDREEREQEAREASVADEILKKLHRHGLESLSDEEKGILNRVSARLRRRRQQGV